MGNSVEGIGLIGVLYRCLPVRTEENKEPLVTGAPAEIRTWDPQNTIPWLYRCEILLVLRVRLFENVF
jgi:hypothetical protein